MICENCGDNHDGTYASGRFCCRTCARAYSTKDKRAEINKKVSQTLTGRKGRPRSPNAYTFTKEDREKATIIGNRKRDERSMILWKETGKISKAVRRFILKEQGEICAICNMPPVWNGKPMIFILDHIDGNSGNNQHNNLRFICSNCDSQLDTYKNRNKYKNKEHNNERYICRKKYYDR